jgi:ParB family chromosome partitioning protein
MEQSLTHTPTSNPISNGALNGAGHAVKPALVTQMVPLAKLVVSKLNVRKHGTKDVASLAASIAAKGLLQPLLVRPMGGEFEVIFGARRCLALKKLNAEGHPDTDFVPCIVSGLDDADAIAASLAENVERLPMDELDQYEAFAALVKEGRNESEIASHFGVTEQVVKRRLALSRLIPDVKALYRDESIDAVDLQLLTLGSKDKQREYVKLCGNNDEPSGSYLKEWLLGGAELATTAALFPLEQYKAPIKADLFGEDSYFTDADEFWKLQNCAIAVLKADLEKNGWEVQVVDPNSNFYEWQYRKVAKDKGGRAVIVVNANGEVVTHKGLIHEDEARKAEKAAEKAKDGKGGEATAKVVHAELSEPLANYVELVRHSAVRAAIAVAPKTGLRVAVAQLIAGSTHWRANVERGRPANPAVAAAVKSLGADTAFAKTRKAAQQLLGTKAHRGEGNLVAQDSYAAMRTGEVYARLTELTDAEVMKLLAVAVAETLAVGTSLVDALGAELKVDVRKGWKPDDTLLSLVRDKEALNGMLGEVAGNDAAHMHLTATAAKKREIIRNALADRDGKDGWLPRWLAFPQQGYSKRRLTKLAKHAA